MLDLVSTQILENIGILMEAHDNIRFSIRNFDPIDLKLNPLGTILGSFQKLHINFSIGQCSQ